MWQLVEHYYSQNYTVFWLAEFFHSWPHISYNGLKKQDPTFNPEDQGYVESLIFWAGLPILWLLVTLVMSLVFSCCLCCKRRRTIDPSQPRPSVNCPKRFLVLAGFISLGLLGLGFYGNEAAAIGVHHFVNSANAINGTVTSIDHKINTVEGDLGTTIPSQIAELEDELILNVINETVRATMLKMTAELQRVSETAAANLSEVTGKLDSEVDISSVANDIGHYDYFRWMGIILLLTFQVITCLFVLLAASRSSRCLLVVSSILSIVCLLVIWCLVGAELFLGVGMSDLCIDPTHYIITEASKKSILSEEVLLYYIQCTDSITNPFSDAITQANNHLSEAQKAIASLDTLVQQYSPSSQTHITAIEATLTEVIQYTQQVTALVDCTGIHKDYISAAHGVCYDTIAGIGFLLLSGISLGLIFTLVLCMSSTLASRIARRKMNYEVDQEDPFLPPPTSTATLERFRRRGQDSIDSASRGTPPPMAPISPTRPHSSHGFGPYDMLSNPGRPQPQGGRTSYVSHQRDSFLEDPALQRVSYDSPPPSYTMAMRRDPNRRQEANVNRSSDEDVNNQSRNRLSAGTASLV